MYVQNKKIIFGKKLIFHLLFITNCTKQEIPSRQQKSAKNDPERYLIVGPNYILVTLIWNDGCFPGHESGFFSKELTLALSLTDANNY